MHSIIISALKKSAPFVEAAGHIERGVSPSAFFGVPENGRAAAAAALLESAEKIIFAACDNAQALAVYDDLSRLNPEKTVFLPAKEPVLFGAHAKSRDILFARMHALYRIASGEIDVVVCPAAALLYPMIPKKILLDSSKTFARGQIADIDELCGYLAEIGYESGDIVEGRGQFARRGGIVDVFPVGSLDAVRIEFFDDEIDTIRKFDAATQRSSETLESVTIIPASETLFFGIENALFSLRREIDRASEALGKEEKTAKAIELEPFDDDLGDELPSLWDMKPVTRPRKRLQNLERHYEALSARERFSEAELYLTNVYEFPETLPDYLDALLIIDEPNRAKENCEALYHEFAGEHKAACAQGDALPSFLSLMRGWDFIAAITASYKTATFNALMVQTADIQPKVIVKLDGSSAPVYHGRIDILCEDLRHYKERGYAVLLLSGGSSKAQRFSETLAKNGVEGFVVERQKSVLPGQVAFLNLNLSAGFSFADAKLLVLSENDIFGTSKKSSSSRKSPPGQKIKAFTDLAVGDFVVHDTHGIGVYAGTVKLEVEGKLRDYLHIRYNGTDKLYIPTDQMNRVQKYIGSQERAPSLSKLGGGDWERQKNKVRRSVRQMAFDLVALYAQRQQNKGFAFSKDALWQKEFEDNFPYEETPDQLRSVEEIKRDMESPICMDRLLCGDVGYGKTEVALRAAFKAVMDGKQVAILAPTTILAQQHYQTICSRFEGFPIKAQVLSRFKTAAEQRETVRDVNAGEVDIIVGTHRLLNKDLVYKDLGLLIIDEEQRFGVAHKEQLKLLKKSVDVLTLSATPIPRTLHMSMVGIRDMSTIETPPEERYPVMTYVTEYSDMAVADAILREVSRGGQVYFVYNRVASIDRFALRLRQLVPSVRIAIAHGQMRESQLEDIMMDFLEKKYDLLLCSTIIESGLDIPSVNTMIVFDADNFGLSQLYQLRGRVGRSNKLAYCYLTVRENKIITETAQKRLSAIKEFTEFGSGFKVAMRDLEIRGAGDIIGAQQSGHMASVGYDMYVKLINEAVIDIKGERQPVQIEASVNLPVDAYLPENYVTGHTLRLDVYKQIALVSSSKDREDMTDELIDRFGDVPEPCENLIFIALIKNLCEKMGVEQVFMRREQIVLRFGKQSETDPLRLVGALSSYNKNGRMLTLANTEPPSILYHIEKSEKPEKNIEASIRKLALILEDLCAKISD